LDQLVHFLQNTENPVDEVLFLDKPCRLFFDVHGDYARFCPLVIEKTKEFLKCGDPVAFEIANGHRRLVFDVIFDTFNEMKDTAFRILERCSRLLDQKKQICGVDDSRYTPKPPAEDHVFLRLKNGMTDAHFVAREDPPNERPNIESTINPEGLNNLREWLGPVEDTDERGNEFTCKLCDVKCPNGHNETRFSVLFSERAVGEGEYHAVDGAEYKCAECFTVWKCKISLTAVCFPDQSRASFA